MPELENPFQETLLQRHRAEACTVAIFGATGDLAYKKIFPALQMLVRKGRLDVPDGLLDKHSAFSVNGTPYETLRWRAITPRGRIASSRLSKRLSAVSGGESSRAAPTRLPASLASFWRSTKAPCSSAYWNRPQ